jgi:hypothetical protein
VAVTLIIEDGTGIANANSYFAASYVDAYALAHGYSAWDGLDDDPKAVAIIQCTAFIDSTFPWYGRKNSQTQGLKWPRNSGRPLPSSGFPPTSFIPLRDPDGFDIVGIPAVLQEACAEAAYLASQGTTLHQDRDPLGKITKKVTGSIEKDYQEESPNLRPIPPSIFDVLNKLLAGLYRPAGGLQSARVIRDNGPDPLRPGYGRY